MSISSQADLKNESMNQYAFLSCMYEDSYFPTFLVDKCKNILVDLCLRIEHEKPSDLEQLYKLTHEATTKINDLEDEFFENDSEIETGARECLGENFDAIAKAYSFDADGEELIAPRNW